MIKLVAFDWNGTLLSDAVAAYKAEAYAMSKYGLKLKNLRHYQEIFIVPIKNYFLSLGMSSKTFDANNKDIGQAFFDYYELLENKCRTRSGTREITTWLGKNKIKRIIFSNHPTEHIKRQLTRLKILNNFTNILGREPQDPSIMHFRSKETRLHYWVNQYKLKPKEVITVGDTDEEIEIGKKFGYYTVALTGGYQSTKRLKATKPDYLIHNLIDLKKIIQILNSKF